MVSVAPNIMHEKFDDETVVVNMDRGHYFALSGPGAAIWDKLSSGEAQPDDLATAAQANMPEVETFLRLLAQEGLVTGPQALDPAQEPKGCLEGTAFAGTFERFTDVEDLLLADPIHDFDASGWSSARQE